MATLTRRRFLATAGVGGVGATILLAEPAWAPPKKPLVTTGAASLVTSSGARLNGTVNPKGSATTYRFDYGPTTAYGTSTPNVSAGSGSTAVAVSAAISGLSSGTLYHFRIQATNAGGTSLGTDATFITQSAGGSVWPTVWPTVWP